MYFTTKFFYCCYIRLLFVSLIKKILRMSNTWVAPTNIAVSMCQHEFISQLDCSELLKHVETLVFVFEILMYQVTVDTLLLESNTTAKAILQLIPVLNITNLVIGTKKPLSSKFGAFIFSIHLLGFLFFKYPSD